MAWDDGLQPENTAHQIASSDAEKVRVIAGPGTGKSFAMKRRVARLLEDGVQPERILPVTFTKVAAEDLHRELVGMGVPGCDQIKAYTLHSFALSCLMRDAVLAVTDRHARPLADFERRPLEEDLGPQFDGIRQVQKRIKAYESAWAREQDNEPGHAEDAVDQDFQDALERWLMFHRAMLIGEVIPIFLNYLRNDPHAPERAMFDHVLVDEYQDLNRAEQELVALLSENAEVCIVGDDDQSIYSFKHAHPEGIREWGDNDEVAPDDITMEECRRCPTRVVLMANDLIGHNNDRDQDRKLVPMAANGEGVVRIIRYANIDAETTAVANMVAELIEGGIAPGKILVLAQRKVIGTPIYEKLVEAGVPVKSYYAEAELKNPDVQERYSYLKLLSDSDDRVALRWLVGRYGSRWNQAGYRRVREECENTGLSPWTILSSLVDGDLSIAYTNNIRDRFEEIRVRIDQLRELQEQHGVRALVEELFPDDFGAASDLRALMIGVLDEADQSDDELGIQAFLAKVDDAIMKPEIPENVEDVRVMSLHKSKGLSSPVTIIAGCNEGLLPMRPKGGLTQAEMDREMEEQRRLFYVGITRVKAEPSNGLPGHLILTSSRAMPTAQAHQARIGFAGQNFGEARLVVSRFITNLGPNAPATEVG